MNWTGLLRMVEKRLRRVVRFLFYCIWMDKPRGPVFQQLSGRRSFRHLDCFVLKHLISGVFV